MLAEEWFNSLPVVRHLHPSHPAQCVDICLLKDFFVSFLSAKCYLLLNVRKMDSNLNAATK